MKPPPRPTDPDSPFVAVGPGRRLRVFMAVIETLTVVGLVLLVFLLSK